MTNGRSVATTSTRSARAAVERGDHARAARSAVRRRRARGAPAHPAGGSPPTSTTSSHSDARQRATRVADATPPTASRALSLPIRDEAPPVSTAPATFAEPTRPASGHAALRSPARPRPGSRRRAPAPVRDRTRGELARLGGEDQDPVRADHRLEHAGALVARAARDHGIALARERHAHEVQPAGLLAQRLAEPRVHERPVQAARAQHAQERRAHELLERHHRRDRIAGQTEHERPALVLADPPERERIAGLDPHAPEVQPAAELLEHAAHEVAVADRDARRAHDHVRGEARAQPALDVVGRVARDAQIDRLGAELAALRRDRPRVRGDDPPARDVAVGLHELVAAREDRDARALVHRHDGAAERREHADLRRADAACRPRARARRARTSSPARRTFSPSSGATRIATRSPSRSVSSWRTTLSAPGGSGAPVRIRAARAARERRHVRGAGGHLERHRQPDRRARRGLRTVRRAHRIAVHRRVVGGRQHAVGVHRLREHAPENVPERHRLGAEHRGFGEHARERLGCGDVALHDANLTGLVRGGSAGRQAAVGWANVLVCPPDEPYDC